MRLYIIGTFIFLGSLTVQGQEVINQISKKNSLRSMQLETSTAIELKTNDSLASGQIQGSRITRKANIPLQKPKAKSQLKALHVMRDSINN